MLRGGVCGFGWAGQDLTERIREFYGGQADIVAVCDVADEPLQAARDKFGIEHVTRDVGELVGHDLDFLAVMSTTAAHHEQVLAGAEAGLPMLIEKPITLTLRQADEMIEAVESRGLTTIVNFSIRHSPVFHTIKQWIDEGYFGDIQTVSMQLWRGRDFWANGMRYRVMTHPETCGTWLVHHTCHALDLVYWLTGQEYEHVYCETATTKPSGDAEEIVWAVGRTTGGIPVQMSDAATGMYRSSMGLQGLRRSVWYESGSEDPRMYVKEDGKGLELGEQVELPPSPPAGGKVAHLMEVLLEGQPSRAPLREGRHSLAAALACKLSAREGRVVRLEEVEE